MSQPDARAMPLVAPSPQTINEPSLGTPAKAAAVGTGIVGSVCCGSGLATMIGTGVGATGAVAFMHNWGAGGQGLELISFAFVVAVMLLLTRRVTRRAREGLAPAEGRRVYGRSLGRLSAWMLGGFIFMTVIVSTFATIVHYSY